MRLPRPLQWIWRRLRAALEESLRQQITLSGALFTVLLLLVGMAAFVSANNLLFLLFAAMLATMLVSGLVSRLGLAGLELLLEVPEHIAARRKVVGRVILRNSKWTPSFSIHLRGGPSSGLSSELYFPILPARGHVREPIEIEFARRGLYKDNEFEFSSRFPFGFAERRAQVRFEREVVVYPSVDTQPGFEALLERLNGELESWFRGRGHDFYRIRPYELNESARHVDWKATAHTGDLQVREFAREEDQSVTLFLDLNVPPEALPQFETVVDCCAFLILRLSRGVTRIRFVTQQFDRTVPDNADAYAILRYLALVEPNPGVALPAPHSERDLYLAFTSNPEALVEAGWLGDRVLDLRRFSGSPDARAGAGKDVHHRRR